MVRIGELPRLGKVVAEVGDEHIREIPIYSYCLIYEIVATGYPSPGEHP